MCSWTLGAAALHVDAVVYPVFIVANGHGELIGCMQRFGVRYLKLNVFDNALIIKESNTYISNFSYRAEEQLAFRVAPDTELAGYPAARYSANFLLYFICLLFLIQNSFFRAGYSAGHSAIRLDTGYPVQP